MKQFKQILKTFLFCTLLLADRATAGNFKQSLNTNQLFALGVLLDSLLVKIESKTVDSAFDKSAYLPFIDPHAQITILNSQSHPYLLKQIALEVHGLVCNTRSGAILCDKYFSRLKRQGDTDSDFATALSHRLNFVVTASAKVSSWTSQFQAFVFVDSKDYSAETFLRSIIHEMYQLVDIKNSNYAINSLITDPIGPGTPINSCPVFTMVSNAEFRYASSAIRAFKVEERILSQLGKSNSKVRQLLSGSCESQIKRLKVLNAKMGTDFLQSPVVDSRMNIPASCKIEEDGVPFQEALWISRAPHLITNGETGMSGSGETLCHFMTEDTLEQLNTHLDDALDPIGTTHQGPRPKVGGT